jgi:hypothetical protein
VFQEAKLHFGGIDLPTEYAEGGVTFGDLGFRDDAFAGCVNAIAKHRVKVVKKGVHGR